MSHSFDRPRGGTSCAANDLTFVVLPSNHCFLSKMINELQSGANGDITLYSQDNADTAYQVHAVITPAGAAGVAVFNRLNSGDGIDYESSDGLAGIWVGNAAGAGPQLVRFQGRAVTL